VKPEMLTQGDVHPQLSHNGQSNGWCIGGGGVLVHSQNWELEHEMKTHLLIIAHSTGFAPAMVELH